MATKRQKLEFQVGANSRRFKREMGRVKGIARSTGMQVAASLGIGLSVGGAIAGANKLINTLDNIGKSAKRMQVDTDFAQKLSFAAEREGKSLEVIEKGIKKMQRVISDAGDGMATYQRTLKHLNLTYDGLAGKSPEEQFKILADRINKVTDAARKSALAQQIFGRAGADLLPMLKNYASLASEFEASGNLIDPEEIKAAEAFKDAMTNLNRAIQSLVVNSGLISWLKEVAEGMEALFTNAKKIKEMGGVEKKVQVGYELKYYGGTTPVRVPKYKTVTEFAPPTEKEKADFKTKLDKKKVDNLKKTESNESTKKSTNTLKNSLDAEQKKLDMLKARLKLSDQEFEKEKIKAEFAERIAKIKEKILKVAEKEGKSVSDEELQKVTAVIKAQEQLKLLLVDLEAQKKKTEASTDYKKTLQTEKEKIKMMRARMKMSEEEFARFKVIAEYKKKIRNAKTQEEKNLYKKQGNLELEQLQKAGSGSQLANNTSNLTDSLSRIGLIIGNNARDLTDRLSTERNTLLKSMKNSLHVIENKEFSWGLS